MTAARSYKLIGFLYAAHLGQVFWIKTRRSLKGFVSIHFSYITFREYIIILHLSKQMKIGGNFDDWYVDINSERIIHLDWILKLHGII